MGKSDFKHGLRGYKTYKCRCEECSEAYFMAKVREDIKNRKARIKHHMIDAAPLISIISSLETRLSTTNRRLVAKWSKNGISIYDADVYCIKLGYHPYEIFGEEYFSGLEDEIEQYKKLYGDNADV